MLMSILNTALVLQCYLNIYLKITIILATIRDKALSKINAVEYLSNNIYC